jgi:hypothetical protein
MSNFPPYIFLSSFPIASIKKHCKAFSLAKRVLRAGIAADMPCTCYYRSKLTCVISNASSRCANYVRLKKLCNRVIIAESYKFHSPLGRFIG